MGGGLSVVKLFSRERGFQSRARISVESEDFSRERGFPSSEDFSREQGFQSRASSEFRPWLSSNYVSVIFVMYFSPRDVFASKFEFKHPDRRFD